MGSLQMKLMLCWNCKVFINSYKYPTDDCHQYKSLFVFNADLAVARVYLYGRLTLNGHDGEAVVLEFLPVKISGILDKWFLREDQALALTYESVRISSFILNYVI